MEIKTFAIAIPSMFAKKVSIKGANGMVKLEDATVIVATTTGMDPKEAISKVSENYQLPEATLIALELAL